MNGIFVVWALLGLPDAPEDLIFLDSYETPAPTPVLCVPLEYYPVERLVLVIDCRPVE